MFKVWRALLAPDGRGAAAPDQAALSRGLRALRESKGEWVVILSRGGHFAAAVFNVRPARPAAGQGQGRHDAPPFEVLAHKTFHRYVVRCALRGLNRTVQNHKRILCWACCLGQCRLQGQLG